LPSPVGHALAGLTIHALAARNRDDLFDVRRAGLIVTAALAPDLDLLLRFVDGRNHHQAESHSLGFALIAAAAAALIALWRRWPRPGQLGLLAGAGWASHLLLDYLGKDTHPPIGIMALWPATSAYFKFPWPLFSDIGRTLAWETVRHNLAAVAWETLLLSPLLVLCWRHRLREVER
jgi:membrane-bound metal-dependent hydrolase YbcI (DUF457 family)